MSTARVAKMSGHFGPIVAALVLLIERQRFSTLFALFVAVSCVLGFFAIYRLTFAVAWNRRAARLAEKAKR